MYTHTRSRDDIGDSRVEKECLFLYLSDSEGLFYLVLYLHLNIYKLCMWVCVCMCICVYAYPCSYVCVTVQHMWKLENNVWVLFPSLCINLACRDGTQKLKSFIEHLLRRNFAVSTFTYWAILWVSLSVLTYFTLLT